MEGIQISGTFKVSFKNEKLDIDFSIKGDDSGTVNKKLRLSKAETMGVKKFIEFLTKED